MKIFTTLVLLLTLVACLKPNDDGTVSAGASVFSTVTSSQVEEAYILNIADWGLSDDGLSIFDHLIDDEYFGLRVLSSSSNPIRELTVQLGKDLQNLTNYLAINGIFDQAQSLKLKLPFSLFDGNSIFLTENSIDYSKYTYHFQANGSAEVVEIPFEVSSEGVFVNLAEFGTVVVSRKSCENLDAAGQCNDLVVTGPTLNFRYYHDKRTVLRKFSWVNEGGEAFCSVNGGASYTPCETATSHTLSVAQFNSKPVFKVKIESVSGTIVGSFDLANSTSGFPNVTFFTCNVTLNSGNFDLITNAMLSTANYVICIGDNATLDTTGSARQSIVFGADNIKIIGDHVNRPLISNLVAASVVDSSVFVVSGNHRLSPIVANVRATTVATTAIGHVAYFNTGGASSEPVFSNVKMTANDSEAVSVAGNNNPYFYDCEIQSLGNGTTAMQIYDTKIHIENSKIEAAGPSAKALFFAEASTADQSVVKNSELISNASSSPAIYISYDSTPPFLHLHLTGTKISTKYNGISIGYAAVIEATNNSFRSLAPSGPIGYAIEAVDISGIIDVDGSNNTFCKISLGNGFMGFLNAYYNSLNTGTLSSGTDNGICL